MEKTYLVTAFNKDNQVVQFSFNADPDHPSFKSPLESCVKASSRNFWKAYFSDRNIKEVSNIKPLQDHVPMREVNSAGKDLGAAKVEKPKKEKPKPKTVYVEDAPDHSYVPYAGEGE